MVNDIAKIRFGAPDDPMAEIAPYDMSAVGKREPMPLLTVYPKAMFFPLAGV